MVSGEEGFLDFLTVTSSSSVVFESMVVVLFGVTFLFAVLHVPLLRVLKEREYY